MPIKQKIELPNETIYEILCEEDGLGCGAAVADIVCSEAHHHEVMTEVYVLVSGALRLYLVEPNQVIHLSARGQSFTILPGITHFAEQVGEEPARVIVNSIPSWTPSDHILGPPKA